MPTVADCLRQHAPDYLLHFGDSVPVGHCRVLGLIQRCRTGELGAFAYACERCGTRHYLGRSCGNRHCPNCQHDKTQRWLTKQTERLIPANYFLVTFTVPRQVAMVLRAHQRDGYDALFEVSSQAMMEVARATKALQDAQLGFFGVLHTWGRDPLVYHPHIHYIVASGGVSHDKERWIASPENFFVHHATLVRVFKAKLADKLRELGLYDQVSEDAWGSKWVVDLKPVGDGQATLKYLAPYVYRVAISNNRIEYCDDEEVVYRYTPSGTSSSKRRRVTGREFVAGFLQHVLPPGFQKIRYYGWMSPNSRISIDLVRWLVWIHRGWTYWLGSGHAPRGISMPRPNVVCPCCRSEMKRIKVIYKDCSFLVTRSEQQRRAFQDTG